MGDAFWISSGMALLCLAGLGVVLLRHVRALADLERALNSLCDGRPIRPVRRRLGGLSTAVAEWLNSTAPALQSRIQRLETDREQLHAVLSGMSEGVLAVDSRQRLLFANPAARTFFALSDESVGRLVPELIRNPQIQRSVEHALRVGRPEQAEVCLPGRDLFSPNHDRILALHGTALPGNPPSGAVLVFHDVTELRRLERMRQDFVANASHELKTPLASIKVNAETLLDWGLRDDTVNITLLRQIDEQVDRLDALVQDMLSLARLESGQETYRHDRLQLAPMLRRLVLNHEVRALTKGLDFEADLDAIDPELQIEIAEEAIHQIVNNLIDNAIKYTAEGGRVRVSARTVRNLIELEVSDTGVGIPREDLPRIFERFYRVDKARSRSQGGTGLGLSIVKHLAQTLGGQVAVESQLGAGSSFTVLIPQRRSTSDASIQAPDHASSHTNPR